MKWVATSITLSFLLNSNLMAVGPIQQFIQYNPNEKQVLRMIVLTANKSQKEKFEKGLRYLATPKLRKFLENHYAYKIVSKNNFKAEYRNLHLVGTGNDAVVILLFNQRGILLFRSNISNSKSLSYELLQKGIDQNRSYRKQSGRSNRQGLLLWAHRAYQSNLCLYSNLLLSKIRGKTTKAIQSLRRLNQACINRNLKN